MTPAPQALWELALRHLHLLRRPFGFAATTGEAGLYDTLFGRDSLWMLLLLLEAARSCPDESFALWLEAAARDILGALAEHQGQRRNDAIEEQPGKILHEYRADLDGRLRAMGLVFCEGRSFAGFDQTFLFVVALCRLARDERFGHLAAAAGGALGRALAWIERNADEDGDGLYEYSRRDPRNLLHQAWRDSYDSVTAHGADVPRPPVAWLSVQAYAYRALRDAAALKRAQGELETAGGLDARADDLRGRVERAFWMEEEDCYAIALDSRKLWVPMVSSDAGHALWAGLPDEPRAERLVRRLLRPDMATPYGVRSLSSRSPFYAPFAYHRGGVWPFDNAILAIGLRRYGFAAEAERVMQNVAEAVARFGSPVELYVVLDGDLLVPPAADSGPLLLSRRSPPENPVQGWTAAALAFMAAAMAGADGIAVGSGGDG
jgi:glycogen debranching enzyme